MPQMHDERKKRLLLWVSVSGTTAVIVALWAFVLPKQLAKFSHDAGSPLTRWVVAKQGTDPSQENLTFKEVLEQQKQKLEELDKSQKESGQQGNVHIDELKAKIDGALNANEPAPATEEPANPESPTPNP